jgi:hypothetical protein
VSIEIVRAHLDAAWNSDWDTLRRSVADNPRLIVRGGTSSHFEWDIAGLYRHISQAWDFVPGTVQLSEKPDGVVEAKFCLTNGGGWAKQVAGIYHVHEGRIYLVDVTDSIAVEGCC